MIYGIDTSHRQMLGDFARMKASGRCDFLIAKATEGVGFIDPQYAASRAGAKAAGILFGSYHFARPGDPVAQADYYLSVAKPVAGEIAVLDMEDASIPDAGNWSAAWCARVMAVTGTPPMIYTYPNFLATHDFAAAQRLGCPLWFADYSDPINPIAPWKSYAIRQFTDKGSVPGQPGTLDCDSSPLTIDQLRALAVGGARGGFLADLTPDQQGEMYRWLRDLSSIKPPYTGSPTPTQLVLGDIFVNARRGAANKVDPVELATALAKLLPPDTAPTQDQVTEAFRQLLGIPSK